jgi:sodium transport system ATP-binding protein
MGRVRERIVRPNGGSLSTMLKVHQLVKRFSTSTRGDVVAVDHLSFHVAAGEVYALLGPNGAGKTTTLRILTTLLESDGGQVNVFGVDRDNDPLKVREKIAYVPAEAGLPDRLTPLEVVRLFATVQGVPNPAEIATDLLSQLGASGYADTPCADLSTGMKRRVVLARALVHQPKVLLLDEPTDGLDVLGRREVLTLIEKQATAGRAVVVSSHIMGEVERICNRIGIMNHGRLVAEGTLKAIMADTNTQTLEDAFVALLAEDD